ncbi:oxygenase MpaB family protein [Aquihabitans sp. G128]|uniref:oxygenase MpaB family protein n=1 Tax=Aquihabitans sp. G128 TaxID=2849779 RepID=UPI002739C3B9|nr:oxygenase MpaB family protein [Aquihabitans sp. G128]
MTATTRPRPTAPARPISRAALELLAPKPVWVPPKPSAVELAAGIVSGTAAAIASPLLVKPLTAAFAPLGTDPTTYEATEDELGDPGWFGPDSVAWRVHADHSLLIAGIAAFTLQTLHPLAMAGVAEHSAFADDFLGRTRRTGEFVQGVVYGSSSEAERLCRMVRKIHTRVVGVAPDGRPYAANDPDLLDWVHISEYLAIAAANRRFAVQPMNRRELDRYVDEVARVGLGTGVVDPPRDWVGLNAALEHHRPNLAVAEYAAAGVAFLDDPPILPAAAKPVWKALWSGAVACLPPVARTLLRLPEPTTLELARCRVVLRTIGSLGDTPPRLAAARRRLGLPPEG